MAERSPGDDPGGGLAQDRGRQLRLTDFWKALPSSVPAVSMGDIMEEGVSGFAAITGVARKSYASIVGSEELALDKGIQSGNHPAQKSFAKTVDIVFPVVDDLPEPVHAGNSTKVIIPHEEYEDRLHKYKFALIDRINFRFISLDDIRKEAREIWKLKGKVLYEDSLGQRGFCKKLGHQVHACREKKAHDEKQNSLDKAGLPGVFQNAEGGGIESVPTTISSSRFPSIERGEILIDLIASNHNPAHTNSGKQILSQDKEVGGMETIPKELAQEGEESNTDSSDNDDSDSTEDDVDRSGSDLGSEMESDPGQLDAVDGGEPNQTRIHSNDEPAAMPPKDDCAMVTQGVVRVSSRPKRSGTALGSSRGGLASKGGRSNDNGMPMSSSTATLSRREMARIGALVVDKVVALGVKKAASARALQKFLRDLTLEVVFIAEPIVDSLSFPYALFDRLGFRAELIHNSRRDKVPNLWIIWKNSLRRLVVIQSSKQLISVSLECNGQMVLVSMIHASCFRAERRNLWMDLVALAASSLPWAVIGDFNATLYSHEKWVQVLHRSVSDHAPILLSSAVAPKSRNAPSRFHRFWMDDGSFEELVREVWHRDVRRGPIGRLVQKLKAVKGALKGWARQRFPNANFALKEATDVVVEVQRSIDQVGMTDELFSKEAEAKTKLLKAVELHEKLWAEKARCKWAKLGDRNSKFSHL
ncbi:uncharacterized protein LOC122077892 [Macadamia integrifolia]|uniref:uncharacterized protein LOC122077892 n=1 Tax=Macadamia integrifolia TaxID=60698 RepID=UPI001C4F6D7E|nr:uncharacterized protein LOC122077892 [Macadamia integrifolia]